jgi:hypothetical protein
MMPDPLKRIPFLDHFTDRRNLDLIRRLGGLYPLAELRRRAGAVPAPGGNEWSWDADQYKGFDEYVHLCFRAVHPMEHAARADGRIADSIFLMVHADVLQWDGVLFTPERTDWRNAAIQQRLQQAEKCEVLVPRLIPLEMIRNLPNG